MNEPIHICFEKKDKTMFIFYITLLFWREIYKKAKASLEFYWGYRASVSILFNILYNCPRLAFELVYYIL